MNIKAKDEEIANQKLIIRALQAANKLWAEKETK